MTLLWSTEDKPHRCPRCWSIPENLWEGLPRGRRARWWWFYHCERCDVWFTRLPAWRYFLLPRWAWPKRPRASL